MICTHSRACHAQFSETHLYKRVSSSYRIQEHSSEDRQSTQRIHKSMGYLQGLSNHVWSAEEKGIAASRGVTKTLLWVPSYLISLQIAILTWKKKKDAPTQGSSVVSGNSVFKFVLPVCHVEKPYHIPGPGELWRIIWDLPSVGLRPRAAEIMERDGLLCKERM